MDWFSWLSKTGLEPSLVYEYGLAFSHNELQQEDIAYLDHEFLQSMGISIAKHRLEILKLARKDRGLGGASPHPMARVLVAIQRTKRCLSKYIRTWVSRDESALVVVPRPAGYGKWRGNMLKRNKKLLMGGPSRLLLTNGTPLMVASSRLDSFSSPMIYDVHKEDHRVEDGDDDDGYWAPGVEEIRWDTMFQNLKPT